MFCWRECKFFSPDGRRISSSYSSENPKEKKYNSGRDMWNSAQGRREGGKFTPLKDFLSFFSYIYDAIHSRPSSHVHIRYTNGVRMRVCLEGVLPPLTALSGLRIRYLLNRNRYKNGAKLLQMSFVMLSVLFIKRMPLSNYAKVLMEN